MRAKKSLETKIYTERLKELRFSWAVLGLTGFEFLLACLLCAPAVWLGFGCGAAAFGASFAGIEVLSRRVLAVGSLDRGVRSGLFWVFFKFFSPLALIYFAVWRDFSVLGVFSGFLLGLANICVVLFFSSSN